MGNMGTIIGGIVGVFVALIVGLNLFEEVSDAINEPPWGLEAATHTGITLDNSTADLTACQVVLAAENILPLGEITMPAASTAANAVAISSCAEASVDNRVYTFELGNGSSFTVTANSVTAAEGALTYDAAAVVIQPHTDIIAIETIWEIIPTITLIGLLIAGAVLGAVIGRSAQGHMG